MKNGGRGESVSRGDSTAAINRENSLFRETIHTRMGEGMGQSWSERRKRGSKQFLATPDLRAWAAWVVAAIKNSFRRLKRRWKRWRREMCSRNFSTAVERTGGNSRVMASCTANYIRLRGRGRGVEKEPLFRTQRDTNEVNTRHTHTHTHTWRERIKALYNPLLQRSPCIRTFRDEPLASLWPPHNATVYSVSSD